MNTDDLIKTAKYLDELGSYKTADQFENKLVKLAQGGKLIVDPAIKKEITFLEQQIKNLTETEPYYTNRFYSEAPYIRNELVKISPQELEKRLAKIKSTEFIKDFNLKRADFLTKKAQEYLNDGDNPSYLRAVEVAKRLRENANSGAISPFESSKKPGAAKPSGSSGAAKPSKPSGAAKPSGSTSKPSSKKQSPSGKPSKSKSGSPGSSSIGSGLSGGVPTGGSPSGGGPSGGGASGGEGAATPSITSKSGTVAELDTLITDLENITANQQIWSQNSNSIIPKIRRANSLFTQLYDSLTPKQARFFGNRLDMISIANTTYVGKTGTGMR